MYTINELLKIENNETRIDEVKNHRKVIIPFVGAGVARSCGLYDWRELLDKLAAQYMTKEERSKYKDKNTDLIKYAEDIAKHTNNRHQFQRKVAELCRFKEEKISEIPALILQAFSKQIVTTNYDEILEHVDKRRTKIPTILPNSVAEITEAIQKKKDFVYHIHGSIKDSNTIILTKSSYLNHYGVRTKKYSPMYETLCSLYSSNMFLFIGCSLKKDYVLDLLKESVGRTPSSNHYAIIELPETEAEKVAVISKLDEFGILPIFFPHGEYGCISTILKYISGKTTKPKKKEISTASKQITEDDIYELEEKYVDETVKKASKKEDYLSNLEKAISILLKEKDDNGELKSLVFKDVMDRLLACKERYALAVSGLQGTGKSTFLSLLYYRLYQNRDLTKTYPIIIDLHYLAKQGSIVDIQKNLSDDLNIIGEFIKQESYDKYIFFVDGTDESITKTSKLENQVINFIQELDKGQFAFCISQAEEIPQILKVDKQEIYKYLNRAKQSIEMHRLNKNTGHDLQEIVNYLAPIYDITKATDIDKLKKMVTAILRDKIDYRTILIILKVFSENPSEKLTLGECFYIHYKEALGDINNLLNVAQSTYNYVVKKKSATTTSSLHPEIFHKNAITRDFFLALFFIHIFLNDYPDDVISDRMKDEIVFTAQVNRFIKDIMETEYKTKTNDLVKSMTDNWEKCSVYMKSQIAYVLGRIDNNQSTADFLKSKWQRLQNELFSIERTGIQEDEDKSRKLFLFRSVSVSLIKYKYTQTEQKFFLERTLKDERLSQINRGFHLAYYGDKAYVNGEDVSYFDNLDSGIEKTISHLCENIEKVLNNGTTKYKFFHLDIITLYSLYQYRYEDKAVQSEYKEKLYNLAKKLLDSDSVKKSSALKDYLLMMKRCFEEYADSAFASMIRELYQVKDQKRAGWVKRNVNFPESIADHMYSSCILGLVTLPEDIITCVDYTIDDVDKYEEYSKQHIKDILLIHDIAESVTGDIPSPEKTEQQKEEEKNIINFYSNLDSFPQVYGLEPIKSLYEEFEKKETINAKLAYEIDKIDALIQAFIYSENNNGTVSKEEWIKYVTERVKTSVGIEILKRILKAFNEDI